MRDMFTYTSSRREGIKLILVFEEIGEESGAVYYVSGLIKRKPYKQRSLYRGLFLRDMNKLACLMGGE